MNRFSKYIIIHFTKYLLYTQIFVTILFYLAGLFQDTKLLRGGGSADIFTLAYYEFLKLPMSVYTSIPITVTIATLFLMMNLMRSNELIAYVTLGGKVRNLIVPFLITSVLMSGLLFVMSDKIIPIFRHKKEKIFQEDIKGRAYIKNMKLRDVWLKDENQRIINIKLIDSVQKKLYNITEYYMTDNMEFERMRLIDRAVRNDEKAEWELRNVRSFTVEPLPKLAEKSPYLHEKNSFFDDITKLPSTGAKFFSTSQLGEIVDIMDRQNISADKYRNAYYRHISHAISVIILVMTVYPLCVNFSRNTSYIKTASKALSVAILYWLLTASLHSLGKTEVVTPFFANFTQSIIFSAVAVWLMFSREKAA